ncbi:MAG: ATP-dependent Clp protease adapter ClpS [Clostridiales bacterium]
MPEKTIFKEEIKDEIKTPRMYRVILLNDDYTTMEFVVKILMSVFNKNSVEAEKIMLDVHYKGKGIVGIYTYDIAKTKIISVEKIARSEEYPLKAIMEEE